MLHTIRQVINDDERWRGILRGLNSRFRHQTVTGRQIEEYISAQAGRDLSKVFDQYLRTAQIPVFNYRVARDTLWYRWQSVVPGFDMAIRVTTGPGQFGWVTPGTRWKSVPFKGSAEQFSVDANFYVALLRDP